MMISKEKEQEYIEKVRKDGLYLKRIKKNQTYNICLEAVKQNGLALEFVKEELKTNELCLIAIKKDPKNIFYVEYQTEELKWEAIKKNAFAIRYVKNPTEEMKLEVMRQNRTFLPFFKEPTKEINCILTFDYQMNTTYRQIRSLVKRDQISRTKNLYKVNDYLFEERMNKKLKKINFFNQDDIDL